MTMTDTILFVKETQTCHYVLHIATPRLCGEPGFKSRIDAEEEHTIRCREIVSAAELERGGDVRVVAEVRGVAERDVVADL